MTGQLEKIKLIVTDIDGTILKSDGTVGKWTKRIFETAHRQGIHTAIATGRAIDALPEAVAAMSCFEYVISGNGTNIYYMPRKEKLYDCTMPPALVREIAAVFKDYPYPVEACVAGKAYVPASYYENPLRLDIPDRMYDYVRSTRHPVADIYDFIKKHENVIESLIMVIDDEKVKADVRARIESLPDIYVTSSVAHYIECNARLATKGETMLRLGRMLGVCPEEMIVFGDGENDLEMFAQAGICVAMANAPDCVRKAADAVTLSQDEEGVAVFLSKHLGLSAGGK